MCIKCNQRIKPYLFYRFFGWFFNSLDILDFHFGKNLNILPHPTMRKGITDLTYDLNLKLET